MERYQYFSEEELKGLQPNFAVQIDNARHISGVAYVLTSTLRSPEENKACGGVPDSSHEKGLAVDIESLDGQHCYMIVKGLLAVGICRIGIYNHHVHADADPEKPQCVIWTGISH